jgi:SAM-dependent methyltransferase
VPRIASFAAHHERYDRWFDEHTPAYLSELLALRSIVPVQGRGLEIGVGTARFAAPLGVRFGVDPAVEMLTYAAGRGVSVAGGMAEALPFGDGVFDYALVVTTICFVDAPRMLDEARRVLRPGGALVIGFIDRTSTIGRHYETHREDSVFYRDATFYGASEVEEMLRGAGFTVRVWAQTLFGASPVMQEIDPVRPGVGQGAFVVVRANASAETTRAASEPAVHVARHASNCRWAMPTLFLPAPYWWDAEAYPWTCVREAVPRILETKEVCTDCPYWEARRKAETKDGDAVEPRVLDGVTKASSSEHE